MSILVDADSRVLVQGITGTEGSFHTRQCIDYGTKVVAGVTPGKGGQTFDDTVPVFNTVAEAQTETDADVSLIFVPQMFAEGWHHAGFRARAGHSWCYLAKWDAHL